MTSRLDTDHMSLLQWRTRPALTTLTGRMAPHPRTDLAFAIMSLHEQTRGCHASLQRARTAREVVHGSSLLTHVLRNCTVAPVLPLDDAAATVFAALVAPRLRVRTMDLRIAAIARARGLVVLTRNTSDFGRVPELESEDWTV